MTRRTPLAPISEDQSAVGGHQRDFNGSNWAGALVNVHPKIESPGSSVFETASLSNSFPAKSKNTGPKAKVLCKDISTIGGSDSVARRRVSHFPEVSFRSILKPEIPSRRDELFVSRMMWTGSIHTRADPSQV